MITLQLKFHTREYIESCLSNKSRGRTGLVVMQHLPGAMSSTVQLTLSSLAFVVSLCHLKSLRVCRGLYNFCTSWVALLA